jgi:hypothetical protein
MGQMRSPMVEPSLPARTLQQQQQQQQQTQSVTLRQLCPGLLACRDADGTACAAGTADAHSVHALLCAFNRCRHGGE